MYAGFPKLSSDEKRSSSQSRTATPIIVHQPADSAALKPTRPEATKIDSIHSTAPTQFPARPVTLHRISTALLEDLPDPPEWVRSPELHTRTRVWRGAISLSSVMKDRAICMHWDFGNATEFCEGIIIPARRDSLGFVGCRAFPALRYSMLTTEKWRRNGGSSEGSVAKYFEDMLPALLLPLALG
jgi:hypothetical protein